jgi:hypothetical protein
MSDRFEVIRDFHSLKNGEIPFPVDGLSTAEAKVTSPTDSATATLY